ncbi:hypothetical protein XELAEV_18015566mg [Xenopus laevis]|uniref:exodeoxyribonuclease III n=1 Tax=Xenopus laevis TaxID=8355 RepID=A0A974HW22_XENLA|nr:hypothetical protein XELAEV_18015566mg [Xenopus laevis]
MATHRKILNPADTQTQTLDTTLKVLSWNVKGLNTPLKRKKILQYLKPLRAHIVCLQETHWNSAQSSALKDTWIAECITASYKNKIEVVL